MTPEKLATGTWLKARIEDTEQLIKNCKAIIKNMETKAGSTIDFVVNGSVLSKNNTILKKAVVDQLGSNEQILARLKREFKLL